MNKSIRIICVLLYTLIGHTKAQNLVPNGGFEQFSFCPSGASQLGLCENWISPTINGSPDYYNSCAPFNTGVGIPYNYFSYGFQNAHIGSAYTGIYLWNKAVPSVREYIEIQLASTLIENKLYQFKMYLNLFNLSGYTTSSIGIYFSDTAISNYGNNLLPFNPQISNSFGNAPDTLNWKLISGNYMAHGGEKYLTIGNFNADSLTDTLLFQQVAPSFQMIYCYIDDVSLIDTSTGIDEQEKSNFELFPNPSNQNIVINSPKPISRIVIYNNAGELVLDFNQLVNLNKYTIDISKLTAGLYHCGIYYNQTGCEMKKFSVTK